MISYDSLFFFLISDQSSFLRYLEVNRRIWSPRECRSSASESTGGEYVSGNRRTFLFVLSETRTEQSSAKAMLESRKSSRYSDFLYFPSMQ